MIQDYFSLDKKGDDYLLLRIINKVDFEEEVVWARDFSLSCLLYTSDAADD